MPRTITRYQAVDGTHFKSQRAAEFYETQAADDRLLQAAKSFAAQGPHGNEDLLQAFAVWLSYESRDHTITFTPNDGALDPTAKPSV